MTENDARSLPDPAERPERGSNPVPASEQSHGRICQVDPSRLRPDPRNETIYGAEADEELDDSIRQFGILVPIIITASLMIVSGHRRWRSALRLGLNEIKAEIREFEDEHSQLTTLLLENQYRVKSRGQQVREAIAWRDLEHARARRRMSEGARAQGSDNCRTPDEEGRALDILAKRVGIGCGTSLKRAIDVVESADELKSEGKLVEAAELLRELDEVSINAAYSHRPKKEAELPSPPSPETMPARIEVGNATKLLDLLEPGSVHLIITTPPTGIDEPYDGHPATPEGAQRLYLDWLISARQVAPPDGRLAVVIPLDDASYRPIFPWLTGAADRAGWLYRSIILATSRERDGSHSRGTVDSARAPEMVTPAQMVVVFGASDKWAREEKDRLLAHEDWLALTEGLWTVPDERRTWEGQASAISEPLADRLIQLLSFPGDVVLDPFSGTGTVPLVAWRLGRRGIGFDLSQATVESARRRIAKAVDAADGAARLSEGSAPDEGDGDREPSGE